GLSNGHATDGGGQHHLDVLDIEPVAGRRLAIDVDVEVVAGYRALREDGAGTRHHPNGCLDLLPEPLQLRQIGSEDLDADRRTNAGGQHVDTTGDRHRPRVRDAGE